MKKFLHITLFLLISISVFANNQDSISAEVSKVHDTLKHVVYIKLLDKTTANELQDAINYAQLANDYAEKFLTPLKYIEALKTIGITFYYKGNFSYSIKYFKLALKVAESLQNDKQIAELYSNIGVINEITGDYKTATQYYNSALEIFIKLDYPEGMSKIYNNLGIVYQELGLFQQSEQYYKKSLAIDLSLQNYQGVASSYNNLATIHEQQNGNLDSALYYYKKALEIYAESNETLPYYSTVLQSVALIYMKQSKFDTSITLCNETIENFKKLGSRRQLAVSYRNLAAVYMTSALDKNYPFDLPNKDLISMHVSMSKLQRAKPYIDEAKKIATEIEASKLTTELIKLTGDYFFYAKQFDSAAIYLYDYITAKDTLTGTENQKRIDELNKKYETTFLEYKIDKLDEENKLNDKILVRNKILLVSLIVLLIFVLIFFVIARKFTKNKNKIAKMELQRRIMRLQMNPHFISNSLVSAQNFILENKSMEASDYLANFSDLMRLSIKATSKDFISLSEELEIVEKYLKVQQRRFSYSFDYQINIPKDLEIDFIDFPPMLLQPFVENCINHAFKNINYKGVITINITTIPQQIKIEIIDNGVGYNPENKDKKHTSYSIKINKERLKIISKKAKLPADIHIFANKDKGTKVEITIPDINYKKI